MGSPGKKRGFFISVLKFWGQSSIIGSGRQRDRQSDQAVEGRGIMLKSKKRRKAKARELLKCFHCGGDMDGRSQEVLRYFLFEWGQPLFCDKCVDEHNEKVEATGEDQVITTPFASDDLVLFAAMIRREASQTSYNQF